MSMHLVGPYMTTTVYSRKKSKVKKKTAKQIQSELKHDKYLRKMGAHPDQRSIVKSVKCYGSTSDSKPEGRGSTPRTDANPPTYDPSMSKRTPNVYTGTEITGIATMHKSNAVPVRGKKQAIEIANMRRG
jgi:hypothetical protein